jgi:hypothetical protein
MQASTNHERATQPAAPLAAVLARTGLAAAIHRTFMPMLMFSRRAG